MTNIALIVLDTLRKDSFDEHFDWLPGHRFENAWSTSHWTVPAHASLFTGKYASEVGVYKNSSDFDCSEPALAEKLQQEGYTTRAFSANPNISKQFNFNRGFEEFQGSWRLKRLGKNIFDWDTFIAKNQNTGIQRYFEALYHCLTDNCDTLPSIKEGINLKLRDVGLGSQSYDDGAREALEYINNTTFGEKEFLFVNLMEAHAPYNAPKEYRTVEPTEIMHLQATLGSPKASSEEIRQAYEDEVRYLSDIYQEIFNKLANDFDTIITLSDHGEILGEHGVWGHNYGLYPEVTAIPACITTDKSLEETNNPINLIDIYTSILDISGANIQEESDQSLFANNNHKKELLTEYHGLGKRHYHTLESQGFDNVKRIDTELNGFISGNYYFHETFDDYEEYGDSPYNDPAEHLHNLVSTLEKREVDNSEEKLDDSVAEQLKDLGYA